ncbi:MAG: methyltransferase domain-containing protein [Deltaproteobacteria bacterium]|nr:methyltransferase domain-containing protein [Deltaproteobacteria bacterium]
MRVRVSPSYMEKLYSFYSPFYDAIFGQLLGPGRRRAFQYLDRRPRQRILEIGIGPGSTLEFYPPRTELVGIDISQAMIDKAREKAARLNSGSTFDLRVMDAGRLEFPDSYFDAVLSAYVITTVSDPRQVCREILRVVKPGGQIIVVNHSRCQKSGHLSRIEDLMAPIFVRIGFTTDLDVIRVMEESGIKILQSVRCNLLNTGRIITGTKQ